MPRSILLCAFTLLALNCARVELPTTRMEQARAAWDPFLDTLQARTIAFFLETTDTLTGMALDRYPSPSPASIAAVGYALTIYPIAAERGMITREEAARRTRNTLRQFCRLPQGGASQGTAGYHGFFYHFLKTSSGAREWNCELSTMDTGLLMAGVLFAQSYFDRRDEIEGQIRQLADTLYRRVEWAWASTDAGGIRLAWDPEQGFHGGTWRGYNEAMILYILALGSPTYPVSEAGWDHWTSRYVWGEYYGREFVNFGPLFGHQYSHCWIDFRGIKDRYMREKGLDYFENSRRATYTHQAYGRQNPSSWRDYADSIWGWTACDGPRDTVFTVDGKRREFRSYSARGVSMDWVFDDGTIAPTAAATSIPFAPEICIPAVKAMARKYRTQLWTPYGFRDAFNPTFVTASTPAGWFDKDHLGIDQGPIVLMIENFRNGMVWKTMKKNPYVRAGLRKAGFTGGWMDETDGSLSPERSGLLDDFESLTGWHTITSEGAKLTLLSGEGKPGKALVMDFDLSGVYGYVIAEKDFSFDVPENYQFTFDMRGELQVNNFEFKLMDDKENVFWIKKLSVEYPKTWTRQRIKKRQLTFAWGPAQQEYIKSVRKIQFVVSCGTGGTGKVYIDNFRFEPIDEAAGKNARATVEFSSQSGQAPRIDPQGDILTNWMSGEVPSGAADTPHRPSGPGMRAAADRTTSLSESLTVDFHRQREVGGLVIDWDSARFAAAYDVLLSDDGNEWWPAYTVENGNGGRDYISLNEGEGKFLRLKFRSAGHGQGYAIRKMEVKGAEFSNSPNDFFRALAAEAPQGYFPRYLLDKQTFWTVVGVNGDTREALINELGQVEVDKLRFSLEPFLYVGGKLVTWNDVSRSQSLLDDYLPIPSVSWSYGDMLTLTVQAVAAGVPDKSLLALRYSVQARKPLNNAKLFVAIRPFQVNPPWQRLNVEGGAARIDEIAYRDGIVHVDDKQVISVTKPTAFGAAGFDQGHITEYLAKGTVPPAQNVQDHFRYASAALEYDLPLEADRTADVIVAVPFHGPMQSPQPGMKAGDPELYYSMMLGEVAKYWEARLDRLKLWLPGKARDVGLTLKSNLGYIFVNRDGPGIQPGSRSYERSWIRDGSLTCAALLRTGNLDEVRQFIDWYATGQFPSGKIPCVMDSRGPDAVPEHDSHGQFIYAVYQYFMFSRDTTWLRGKFDAVVKTVRYIQSLRAERKTDLYKNGTPAQRALYGLVPESISHEGYWAVPRHSYWDDFFVLRGLKDATSIARALGEKDLEKEFAAERDDFRKDFYASIRLAMENTNVEYVPGCAELGDFDATSTTVGVTPGGELGQIPEPALHNTFDKYYKFFSERAAQYQFENYTPYENRVIGTFVYLGEKKRAEEAMNFFMHDRRPPAWNHWAEVVWRDPATPKFIGDMPHTWCGSDFIRSVLSMFVLEREKDDAHVLAAGIPDSWIEDSAGVRIEGLMTYYGSVNYAIRTLRQSGRSGLLGGSGKMGKAGESHEEKGVVGGDVRKTGGAGKRVVAEVSGTFDAGRHKLVIASPFSGRVRSARVNGKSVPVSKSGEVQIRALPAKIEFRY